ncbi:sugar phosphate isomerase/epimerase family protein [Natronobacterium gregoryi]|uniref:Sugar phosphate isomerase/epimerase n=2 Tax=Natronobacterium gregoryi TaxID=44930 RepID=L0AFG2_NATGS|nr:sugar phosphate isomerase/epimerase [Natronobacterium gregoryi]AFZ71887.1 sugar phosphate isomerase/epimerase [Natronobacterium gregoryi SP2]ELY62492.1 Xylose isomerase domain-containing protein TIM barrel [Natronobacterium gregoryi SP2]PLK20673.1 sugar phosphate isomerase/epimerase [Natronobacterium gregoryi SP2]SFJ14791.1 Sugar phosphate isomerase/epimerase [Natronobacterium gregoryi]
MDLGLTVGDSIDRTARTIDGFDFAELSIGEGTDMDSINSERLETVLEGSDADLCVHLPFKQVVATSVPEIDDAIREYLSRLLEWAGSVDARKAVLHGTARNPHDTDLRPIFAAQLEAIGTAAEAEGVELVVENVGHQKRGLPLSVLGDLARETDTSVCFDIGHAYMEDGNDAVDRFLSGYGDLVSHLHVHDARSRGDTHLPIGAGEIDYGIVTDHLAGFDGTVAIEVFTDDLALLQDTGERATAALEDA